MDIAVGRAKKSYYDIHTRRHRRR